MAITSRWSLPPEGIRFLTPAFMLAELAAHPLLTGPYPLATGYYPNGHAHKMERWDHSNYLLIYCAAGVGSLEVNGQKLEISPGSLILLPPGIAHRYQADEKEPWSIYWVHFDGPHSQEFYEHLGMRALTENIGLHPEIISNFEAAFELRRTHHDIDGFIHGCHLLHKLLSLLTLLIKQHRSHPGIAISLNDVQGFMIENIHGQMSLDTLAKHLKLSKYYFSKRFKALTGYSPIQYFINLKMQRACEWLDSSEYSVKQVGLSLGYDDPYYFSRLFKKTVGLSPVQYRESRHK